MITHTSPNRIYDLGLQSMIHCPWRFWWPHANTPNPVSGRSTRSRAFCCGAARTNGPASVMRHSHHQELKGSLLIMNFLTEFPETG